jgi:regulator of CtrA degradation
MDMLASGRSLERRLIDSLYTDAIILADEARAYFDLFAEAHRDALETPLRLDFACESLKVTTRIMHVIAWLLTQRAVFAGELREEDRLDERHRLGEAVGTDAEVRAGFSPEMEGLILVSEDLYDRAARLERQLLDRAAQGDAQAVSPVRSLLDQLEARF